MRLQQLSQIMVQFNPLDPKCTSAREFLRRCVAPAARKSNPECELFYRMRTDRQPPVVHVTYSNGNDETIVASKLTAQQIIQRINSSTERMKASAMLKDAGYPNGVYLRSYLGFQKKSRKRR